MNGNPRSLVGLAVMLVVAVLVAISGLGSQGARGPKSAPVSGAKDQPPSRQTPVTSSDLQAGELATGEASAPAKVPTGKGDFDFYLLSLSWSPTHCSGVEGQGRSNDLQCRSGRPYGFVLHGFWPQYERGYPESCASEQPRRVLREVMREALKLSPSERLVQHEWEKHGTCSGLSQADYYSSAGLAVGRVKLPRAYDALQQQIFTTADDVRRAFLDANPALAPSGILVTCRRNDIGEVRVCLDKELLPRACSREVLGQHCGGRNARMQAARGNWPR